eukprot:3225531-Alexandrium_andersonii.AAC.1
MRPGESSRWEQARRRHRGANGAHRLKQPSRPLEGPASRPPVPRPLLLRAACRPKAVSAMTKL